MSTRFSVGDTVYRNDSGENAATVVEIVEGDDEPIYRLAYAEGGDGYWAESCLFGTIEERAAALEPPLI